MYGIELFERAGGVDVAMRISMAPLVEAKAGALEGSLPKAKAGRSDPRRVPVLAVIALDDALLDDAFPADRRFLAGFKSAAVKPEQR